MSNTELKELRQNKDYLKQVYQSCKANCFAFMAKCFGSQSLTDEQMLTIYNDAIIVLYENAQKSEFKLTCAIQTYINSICRNMAKSKFREEKKLFKTTDLDTENLDFDHSINDELEEIKADNPYMTAVSKALTIMKEKGGNCAEILTMFFYQKASMEEIAAHFDYTNARNAKVQKSRCQKRLKDLAHQFIKI
jgi:RNA polymerase sigma factor (sigma-70 family)